MGIKVKNLDELVVDLSIPGTQTAANSQKCFVVPFGCVLKAVYAKLGTAGTTNNQDVDINKNGTTILSSTGGIRFATTSTAATAATYTTDPPVFAKGDIITVDIDAVHSTPAVNLALTLVLSRRLSNNAVQNGGYGQDAE